MNTTCTTTRDCGEWLSDYRHWGKTRCAMRTKRWLKHRSAKAERSHHKLALRQA